MTVLPFLDFNVPMAEALRRRFVEQTFEQKYDSGRSDILAASLRLFERRPIAGNGLDGYYALVGSQSGFEYPHSLPLATLAEAGLLGGILLILALVTLYRSGLRRPLTTEALFFLAAGSFVVVASLFSGDYYDSRFLWLFLLLAGLIGVRRAASGSMPVDPKSGQPRATATSTAPSLTSDSVRR